MSRRFVVAYFTLREGDSLESYRHWSLSYVRPVMRAMPSVISFIDFSVFGVMEGAQSDFHGCEIIEVSDVDEFESDNATGEGAVLGAAWRDRLLSYQITYLEDLEQGPSVP